MAFLDFLFGRPKPARRRRRRGAATSSKRKRSTQGSTRQAQRELDRQAAAWLRTDDARRRREQQQRDRAQAREQRQRIRVMRIETEAARRADAAYRRQKARLLRDGWSAQEADELLSGYQLNPKQRQARMVAACHGLAIRNPAAEDASLAFHGTPSLTRNGKVVVGQLEEVVYRAPRRSKRAGTWSHQAGDRGLLATPNRGRATLLADPKSGRVELDTRGSGLRFSPTRGLIG
jgi:hypothetical protein